MMQGLALGRLHAGRFERASAVRQNYVSQPRRSLCARVFAFQDVPTENPAVSASKQQDKNDASGSLPAPPVARSPAPAQMLLPVSWELQMDEVIARYSNMDERMDAMERQLLEMMRELRTGTASLTGGVTSISQGGSSGAPAASGLFTTQVATPETASTNASQPAPSDEQASPGAATSSAVAVEHPTASFIHASGTTSRATVESTGLRPPDELLSKAEIVDMGKQASALARQAAEQEQEGKGEEDRRAADRANGSPVQQALSVAKDRIAQGLNAQSVLDSLPTPSEWIGNRNKDKDKDEQNIHKGQTAADAHSTPAAPPSPQKASDRNHDGPQSPGTPHIAAGSTSPSIATHQHDGLTDDSSNEAEIAKAQAVAEARQRLLARATEAGAAITGGASTGGRANVSASGKAAPVKVVTSGDEDEKKVVSGQGLLNRDSLYGFNKLQSAITELANSGYIESVKQLRETLLIQEWDMSNRHVAKRRGVAMFERYVAERDLVHEIGGYVVISALYEDPDAMAELLPNDRMRMLCRSMVEQSMNDRRMEMYALCNQTAKEMAALTSSGVSSRLLVPMRAGFFAFLWKAWAVIKAAVMPWTRFLPF